ncbi:MAG: MFS transporter [Candidatus Firestonebacteria bacterium]
MEVKQIVLLCTILSSFIVPFMASSINISLPLIAKEFSMDAILLGWVATSYLLSAAIFLVPFGRMADIYGRKKSFLYGTIIYTIASTFLVFSNSSSLLIAFRVLQGIGGAMIFGAGTAILISVFPIKERGKALGINVASVYLGLSMGPFLGGIITQHFGWRSIFLINVPVGIIIILLVLWKLKGEWTECEGEKFDWIGSIIFVITFFFIMYGFSSLPARTGILLILMGVLGFLMFIKWEAKIQFPVYNINLFKNNTVFAFSNLAALINYSATFSVTFLLSLYLQYIKALSPKDAGLILFSQPIVMAIFSPLAGKLSDKIEPRIVSSIGMILATIGLFLFTFLGENTTITFIVFTLILLGFGFALFSSPNTNAVMSSVDKKYYGIASATLGTMRLIGQMLSMGFAMLVFSIFIGKVQITPFYYPLFIKSVKTLFMIFSIICFGGIFASFARGKLR